MLELPTLQKLKSLTTTKELTVQKNVAMEETGHSFSQLNLFPTIYH